MVSLAEIRQSSLSHRDRLLLTRAYYRTGQLREEDWHDFTTSVSLADIWHTTLSQAAMIRLARAYYRTGQLRVMDRGLMAAVQWDPCNYYDDDYVQDNKGIEIDEYEEHAMDSIERYKLRPGVPSLEVQQMVTRSIAEFQGLELALFRVMEFMCLIWVTIDPKDGDDNNFDPETAKPGEWRMGCNLLAGLLGEAFKNDPRLVLVPTKTRNTTPKAYARNWRQALQQLSALRVAVYVNTISNVHYGRMVRIIDEIMGFIWEDWSPKSYPILQAYLSVVEDVLEKAGVEIPPNRKTYPRLRAQLYAPVIPLTAKGLTNLPDVLEGMVYGLTFEPTYDQILHRLLDLL